MPDTAFLLALVGAILGAASIVLHVVAPRTKNTIDDALRDDIDEVLAWWRGRQAGVVPGAPPPPTPPRNPQAGLVRWLPLAALAVLGIAIACTAAQRTATLPAVIDCTAASSAAIGATAASMRAEKPDGCAVGGVTNWHCVENKAIAAGVVIGGCAFLEVAMAADKAPAAVAPVEPQSGRAAFESYRASVAGGAQFRTTSGLR
jgi:hypothetical protein